MTNCFSNMHPRQKRLLTINVAVLLVLSAIVIGVSVGVSSKKKKENSLTLSADSINNYNGNATSNNALRTTPTPNPNNTITSSPMALHVASSAAPSVTISKYPTALPTFIKKTVVPTNIVAEPSGSPVVDVGLPGAISDGVAAGIPYLHCYGKRSSINAPLHEIILLHGASLTKEDWETSGNLDIFCNDYEDTSVTALDLSIRATHDDLQSVIDALKQSGLVKSLPISGIVTPSASGATINDWIFNGNVSLLKEEITVWIPVSSPSIASHSIQNYTDKIGDWHVLAIYGDQDSGGKRISQRVTSGVIDSQMVELPGGHPVYLQSPAGFVKAVIQFVSKYDTAVTSQNTSTPVTPLTPSNAPSGNNVIVSSPTAMPASLPPPIIITASPTLAPIVSTVSGIDLSQSQVGKIQAGTAAGVAYFHVFSKRSSNTAPLYEIILLHGASFTKEIWETSGILDIFGANTTDVAVTALDLSIYAKHDDLQNVIDELKLTGVIRDIRNRNGIVTPSASGATIVDWIFNGNVTSLKQQIKVWVPVSSPSILSYSQQDFTNEIGDWHVLAIYGDQDSAGKKISELVTSAVTGSKMVELQGGHPVYLQSPDAFVKTVVNFVRGY